METNIRLVSATAGLTALSALTLAACSSGGSPTRATVAPLAAASPSAYSSSPQLGTSGTAAEAPAVINTADVTATYDCTGVPRISIQGADSNLTFVGSCGEVDVTGADNTVNLPAVAVISATGTDDRITWQSGPNGAVPQITNTGVDDTVTRSSGPVAPAPASGPQINLPGIAIGPNGVNAAGAQQITSSGETKTVVCNNNFLGLTGSGNTLTVTGHCAGINVDGTGNTVTVDSTDAINVTGQANTVTYHSGSPIVNDAGSHDSVAQG
jgi:hypothetical protein